MYGVIIIIRLIYIHVCMKKVIRSSEICGCFEGTDHNNDFVKKKKMLVKTMIWRRKGNTGYRTGETRRKGEI